MLQTSALQPGQELDRPERVGPLGSQGHGGCAGWCVDFATLSSFSCVNIGCCSICCCIYINIICHLLTVKSMRAVRLGCYEMGHGCTHVAGQLRNSGSRVAMGKLLCMPIFWLLKHHKIFGYNQL